MSIRFSSDAVSDSYKSTFVNVGSFSGRCLARRLIAPSDLKLASIVSFVAYSTPSNAPDWLCCYVAMDSALVKSPIPLEILPCPGVSQRRMIRRGISMGNGAGFFSNVLSSNCFRQVICSDSRTYSSEQLLTATLRLPIQQCLTYSLLRSVLQSHLASFSC
jgi:hypothetical protein